MRTTLLIGLISLTCLLAGCVQGESDGKEEGSLAEVGKIEESSTRQGDWIQEHSIIVKGSLQEVWELCTNDALMQTHMAPLISVDFRNGGSWEASYDLNAKLGDPENFINEIVNIIPFRSYTTKGVKAPFEIEAMKSLRSTLSFESLQNDQLVKVTATTTGWEGNSDEDYRNTVFNMSNSTNPEILKCLNARLTDGPLDWEEVLSN